MSRWIRLSDSRGRDARVRMEANKNSPALRFQTEDGKTVASTRIIKSHLTKSYSHLLSRCNHERELAHYLMDSNPEIDLEVSGRMSGATNRVLLNSNEKVLYTASEVEIIHDANGYEVERREPVDTPANIDTETPLVWTGKYFKRTEAVRKFVFSRNYQIRHINGLTFDFLFAIAQELDGADSLVLIGTGFQGSDPLILERNGLPYRGFLEGRIQENKYLLILHLSHLELLPPNARLS
jgi:hypothetical protein